MEKNQYELCLEVFRRLNQDGVLEDVILIGSWCTHFYQSYFSGIKYSPNIRTKEDKAIKDRNAAVEILRALISKGETVAINCIFDSLLPKWQKKIIKGLEEVKEEEISSLL